MYGRVEILNVKFHSGMQALTREGVDDALLGSGYGGMSHNVPSLYPRPRLPDGLIAGSGVLSPLRRVEVRARVGCVEFGIVNERTDAGFDQLETWDGRRFMRGDSRPGS